MSDYGGDDDAGAGGADFDFEAAAYVIASIASTSADLTLTFAYMVVMLIITMSVSICCCGKPSQKHAKTPRCRTDKSLVIPRPRTMYQEAQQAMLLVRVALAAKGTSKRKTQSATTK